ncbi:MAG: beta-mannosidase, partial [Candidatus Limnocylindrales bacterium]
HDYPLNTMPGDRWNGLVFGLKQCATCGKPLFVGEVGIKLAALGGDKQRRADFLAAKISTQRAAGVVGHSVWAWSDPAQRLYEDYLVTSGDPLLDVLRTP